MDLSFTLHHPRHAARGAVRALPVELAVLLAGAAARQAASPTARLQAVLDRVDPAMSAAPRAFNRATAAMLARPISPVKVLFT